MALTEMVIMPGEDYQAICDSVRGKTGRTELLKSGNIAPIIDGIVVGGEGVQLPTLDNPGDASDLLEGVQLIGQDGGIVNGAIPKKTSNDITASGAIVTVPAGYYENDYLRSISMISLESPTISVNASGQITASVTQPNGYVSASTKSATKKLSVSDDANFKAENIKKGVSIFGVTGTLDTISGGSSDSSSGTAISGVTEFTLAEDASTAGTAVKLGNVPWIAEHINDANLFAALIKKDTSTTTNAVALAASCNSKYFVGRYAASIYKTTYMFGVSTAASGDLPFNDITVNNCARIAADANGDVYVIPYSSYYFAAADYSLIYGLL